MQELSKQNEISPVFYKRYFEQNAIKRVAMEMLRFMWFKEGHFINPMKKDAIIETYINEEKEQFFEKKIFNMPQIEFSITTKCTLKCKDCCALIPQLDKVHCTDMRFEEFKLYLDKICDAVDMIRHLIVLGGEPLTNPDLPQMLEYAAQKDNIFFIQLITNGTMLPKENLLEVLEKYNKRIYVYMSNYAENLELKSILKQEEIRELLKKYNIKLQKPEKWAWLEERGLAKTKFNDVITEKKFLNCYRTKCNHVMNGRIDICSKAYAGRNMHLFEEDDSIDIVNSENLRQDLIDFYQKEYPVACKYCILSDKQVQPALQA